MKLRINCKHNITTYKLLTSNKGLWETMSIRGGYLRTKHIRIYEEKDIGRGYQYADFACRLNTPLEEIVKYLLERNLPSCEECTCADCPKGSKMPYFHTKTCKTIICTKNKIDEYCNKCKVRFKCLTSGG